VKTLWRFMQRVAGYCPDCKVRCGRLSACLLCGFKRWDG